jgi:hypothetical protein
MRHISTHRCPRYTHKSSVMRCRFCSPGPSPSANRRLLAEHEPGLAVGAERITDRSALRRSKLASERVGKERRFSHRPVAPWTVPCIVRLPKRLHGQSYYHLGPFPPRPRSYGGPFPLWPRSHFNLFLLSPVETCPLRLDLTRRCSYRDAQCVARRTERIGRAPREDCGAHVGESSVRSPCKLRASCSIARAGRRRAYLQRATCHATRHPSCDAVGICISHRFRM